jgi:predicted AlkP superfamily phosphohydrolase/phosphomutase/tetratricopeptide (TPR) repeat protein
MPNLQRLVENGSMAQIATLQPAYSPMLWTSIATGKRPFKHGIHGFSEPTPDGRSIQPVTNLSRKCKAVWNILNQNGLRSVAIGWWPSHPAEPIDGVTVSDLFHKAHKDGRVSPLPKGAVHPPELHDTLAELRIHPAELPAAAIQAFVPRAAEIDQDKDARLASVAKILSECSSIHSAATWLLDNQPWDFFAVYYDAIDHFSHGFMKYHAPRRPWIPERDFELYQNVVNTAYCFHDQMLGTLLRKAGDDVTVILLSDHGFHPDHLRPRAIPRIPAGPAIEHRDYGILVISGPGIKRDELIHGPSVLDITPTVLALYDLPIGVDMDGKVLTGAFEEPPAIPPIPSWEEVEGRDGRHPAHTMLDPVAARETLDQLVALGYIEKPDADAEKAVERTVRELRFNLCEAYQDADRHAEALDIARELYASYPDDQRYALRVFISCQALGRFEEMRRVVEDLDTRRRQLYEDARARMKKMRQMAKARAAERKSAAAAAPPPAVAEKLRRELLFTPEERMEYRHARDLARYQPATVEFLKAQVLTADRKWFEALQCLERVREGDMIRPGLFVQSAELYRRLRRYEEAEQTYLRVLAIDPDNPHAHLGLARLHLRKRNPELAVDAALECIQRRYHYPMAHLVLAAALVRLAEPERAADALRVAIALNPNFPQAHRRLAALLRRLGDAEGAEEHRNAYRELRRSRGRAASRPADQLLRVELPAPAPHDSPALPPIGEDVVVVSGLPRSGTSMVMQMLAAGGMPILTDGVRQPDEDNPRGYFEFEPVKDIHRDSAWIPDARGKAVKIVAPLLPALPRGANYRIVVVERNLDEVLASQSQMLVRRGEAAQDTEARRRRIRARYARLMIGIRSSLPKRNGIRLLTLDRAAVLRDPAAAAETLNRFLGGALSVEAMAAEVKPELHRQRVEA